MSRGAAAGESERTAEGEARPEARPNDPPPTEPGEAGTLFDQYA